jgi:hypothetical protein
MRKIAIGIAVGSLLAACGGGDGSSSATPPAQQNLQSIAAPAQPWTFPTTTLTATDSSGNVYTVDASNVAAGSMTFNGQVADTAVQTITVAENGVVLSTSATTAYYLMNPYSPLGLSGSANGTDYTFVVTSFSPFPAMLTVGSAGPVLSGNYEDSMGNVIGSLTETYTVTADSDSALFVNIDGAGTLNGTAVSETITYSLDVGSGLPTLTQVVLTVNGTTLTFQ